MPNILMAGAAGRNLGKTEFLCRAIRAQSQHRPVIGIKITTIDNTLADYRNINAPFIVSTEEPANDNKDTHRMYRAGATKVFWLRVKRPHLLTGITALLVHMKAAGIHLESDCLVMESGGARAEIEPGLFFIIQEHNDTLKPAVANVAHLADRLNHVNASGWDVLPEDLHFKDGRWNLKEKAAAIVLSGGSSRRMGADKSMLKLHGQPLITSVINQLLPNVESIIISGPKEKYAFTGCPVVEDIESDCGPLMGLLSALKTSNHDLNFITACDVPQLNLPFIRRMLREAEGFDAVVPVLNGKQKQPLFAVYTRALIPTIEQLLAQNKRSMHALLDQINVHELELSGDWYYNLNTPEDLEAYRKKPS